MQNETKIDVIHKVQRLLDMILQKKGLSVSIHVGTQKMVNYT